MNVLSLFDGMSCGQLALQRSGLKVSKYFASEIDKYAMSITQKNFPDTVQLGDVRGVYAEEGYLLTTGDNRAYKIDLLIGGSPCQDLSIASRNRKGLEGERSGLFYEWVRLWKTLQPRYFLLENVQMKAEDQQMITDLLGVEPVFINSNLVSAQNRPRLYWTNIPVDGLPEDKGIKLADILEDGATDRDKAHCIDANYFKGGNLKSYFQKNRRQLVFSPDGLCHVADADLKGHDLLRRVYHPAGKAPCLNTMNGGNREPKTLWGDKAWRKLTPLECERLQTVPDNYSAGVSNTQRYRMLGNGWTVDVICHLFKNLQIEGA